MVSFGLHAQKGKECIDEVLKLEEKNTIKNFNEDDKALNINYTVKTTDWENQTIVSNIKVYKGKNNTHFFSEQGIIFQDEKDVYMLLPIQKLIIINSTKKELYNKTLSDDFFELRKGFLDSCDVVKCESSVQNPFVKILELKVTKKVDESVQITKMIYEYNTQTEKIESTKIFYNTGFKVKSVVIIYKEINLQSDYKFGSSRRYVFEKNNRLLPKYKDYELVDNRKYK